MNHFICSLSARNVHRVEINNSSQKDGLGVTHGLMIFSILRATLAVPLIFFKSSSLSSRYLYSKMLNSYVNDPRIYSSLFTSVVSLLCWTGRMSPNQIWQRSFPSEIRAPGSASSASSSPWHCPAPRWPGLSPPPVPGAEMFAKCQGSSGKMAILSCETIILPFL